MKKTFVSAAQLEQIAAQYPTPFHIYDEQGIRENARRLNAAFSWNPGFREYFAVKATPTPAIMKVLQEEGCGCDCSSLTELMMAERIGCVGEHIVFSSNETPAEDYRLAAKLGAVINLDDLTHVDFLERAIGYIPKKIGCRFNPGGTFSLGETREGFQVMADATRTAGAKQLPSQACFIVPIAAARCMSTVPTTASVFLNIPVPIIPIPYFATI